MQTLQRVAKRSRVLAIERAAVTHNVSGVGCGCASQVRVVIGVRAGERASVRAGSFVLPGLRVTVKMTQNKPKPTSSKAKSGRDSEHAG